MIDSLASSLTRMPATFTASGMCRRFHLSLLLVLLVGCFLTPRAAQATIPAAPTGVAAASGNTQVTLTWTASSGATSYSIFRGTAAGGESTTAIKTGQTASPYINTGLTNGTAYYYKIKAVNASGSSGYSSEVNSTPQLTAPTGVAAAAAGTQITISWTAVTTATSYSIYRGTSAGGESPTAIKTGQAASPYADTGLANGVKFYYKVTAVSAASTSANSSEVSATTIPGVPAGLTVAPGNAQAVLSWAASAGAATYNVKRSTVSGSGYATVSSPATNSYTNTGLTNGTTYYYVVTAVNGAGETAISAQGSATPLAAPAAPSNLAATAGGGQVALVWTASANATSYNVYRGTAAGGESATAVATGIVPVSYTDTGLSNLGVTYYYKIKAVGVGGTSAYGNEASATPSISEAKNPNGLLIQASDGNLYGTTSNGGASGMGTIYKMTPGGTVTVLHAFTVLDGSGFNTDGAHPYSGVAQASDGNFYGTTNQGGTSGLGVVYQVTPTGTYTVLHVFTGTTTDGANPYARLIQASDGNLYGTTPTGGLHQGGGYPGYGTVYSISTTGAFTLLHSFYNTDGATPYSGVIQAVDGNLYGVTFNGGDTLSGNPTGHGAIYQMTLSGTFALIYQFGATDGNNPYGELAQGSDGTLYGTTYLGGSGAGTAYKITPAGAYAQLHVFNTTDGYAPEGSLTLAGDGYFYGTAYQGGSANLGVLFRMDGSGAVTVLHNFTGYVPGNPVTSDGSGPTNTVAQANDGYLYGTTFTGGSMNNGTVYRITTTGTYTIVRSLNAPPGIPANLVATATSSTQVTLNWNVVPAAGSYNLKRGTVSGGPYATIASPGANTYLDTNLTTGTTYYYVVTAVIAAGESANSLQASATPSTAPVGPANLTATAGLAQVSLAWNTVASATTYNVLRATVSGGPYTAIASPSTNSYLNTGLTNGTPYYYVVNSVVTGVTTQNSNQAAATPSTPGPSSLTATPGNAQVALAWSSVTGATSYNVKRAFSTGGPYTTITSPTVPTTSYLNTGLTNGSAYYYVVTSVNSGGESANSPEASAMPAYPPPAVYSLIATPGNARVALTWSIAATATSYNIKRSTVTGGGYATNGTTPQVQSPPVAYTDTTTVNGTTYYYIVTAINNGGESPNSPQASGTPQLPPPAPTNLTVAPGNGLVTLSWTASDRAASYNVKQSLVSGGPYTTDASFFTIPVDPGYIWGWSDDGTDNGGPALTNGTMYYYTVSASNVGGESPNSNEASATPFVPIPGIPKSVSAAAGDGLVNLSWGSASNADGYNIYRSTTSGSGYAKVNSIPLTGNYNTDSGLLNGAAYYYTITSTNAAGESAASAEVTVTPSASQLTAAQALQIATNYCQTIGIPVTVAGTAVFPTPKQYIGQQDSYWQPRWLVTFPDQAELEIVDATQAVSEYINQALLLQLENSQAPLDAAVSSSTAITQATAALQATGQSASYASAVASLAQLDTTAAGQIWGVTFQRMYQAFPYRSQQVVVQLQGDTGTLLSLSLAFPSPDPVTFTQNITNTQAAQTSAAQLTASGFSGLTLASEPELVVQPNTFWQQGGSPVPIPGPARVAWVCTSNSSDGQTGYEVWVDAETGTVIGGENSSIFTASLPRSGITRSTVVRSKWKLIRPQKVHNQGKRRPRHIHAKSRRPIRNNKSLERLKG